MPELTRMFKALSDDTRLRMLKQVLPGELCVCEIMRALNLSQSRASRNLGILRDAGLLNPGEPPAVHRHDSPQVGA